MRHLYHMPWYAVWQNALEKATKEVEGLDRRLFSDPSLSEHLQAITEKYTLNVAQLDKENVAGTPRESEREGADLWGDRQTYKDRWYDIRIPFAGDKESFEIMPSNCTIPSYDADVHKSELVVRIPDDNNTDNAVQSFIRVVEANLQTLQTEYERAKPQLEQTIQQAADRRKAQVEAESARDKSRSFKVVG